MKILAPINNTNEIPILSKAGAEEFFCGYVPDTWLKKYNKCLFQDNENRFMQISINKRDGINHNITDLFVLKEIIREAKSSNSKIYVTLNYLFYPEDAYKELDDVINEFSNLGVDGLIVTDIGIINFISKNYPNITLILSTCQSVFNSWAINYYKEMGIKRITFPRHSSLSEICDMSYNVNDMEFECFILDEGKCIYDDGNCKALHGIGNFCLEQWEYNHYAINDKSLNYIQMENLYECEELFKRWTKPYPTIRTKVNGWTSVGCAICAIPKLMQSSNITTLKISGRGTSVVEKFGLIKYVKKAIKMSEKGMSREDLREYGKKTFGIPEHCDSKIRCYLPIMEGK